MCVCVSVCVSQQNNKTYINGSIKPFSFFFCWEIIRLNVSHYDFLYFSYLSPSFFFWGGLFQFFFPFNTPSFLLWFFVLL